jgi:hypothetical protein
MVTVDSYTGVIREETISVAATEAITNVRIFQRWRLTIQRYSESEIEAAAAGSCRGLEMRQLSTAGETGHEAGAGDGRTTSGSSIFLFLDANAIGPDRATGRRN